MPASTYRLQITADFPLSAAAEQLDYLAGLGADWVYLSPLLQAEPGSTHGYDVVDHSRVDRDRGGAAELATFCDAAHARGLGVLVDIVPNHVGVATPALSTWWWDVLTHGRESRYAEAFDIDWAAGDGKVLLPVLGAAEDVDALTVDGDQLAYAEHRFPIAAGTGGGSAREVHDRQHYRLLDWQRGDRELNYRRFFAITTLAAIRVELPAVFDESHAEILRWVADGLVDGLRVDHPDGLFDPAGYLDRLASATGGRFLLVEKILEPGESLPVDWACDGTTGYDALAVVDRILVDPAGEAGLTALDTELRDGDPLDWHDLVHGTKRTVTDQTLRAEVERLARLIPAAAGDIPDAVDALAELLANFPVYRTYLVPPHSDTAPVAADLDRDLGILRSTAAESRRRRPDLTASIDALLPLLRDPGLELCRRFQQTSGMVMAKGVEDCAFYRYTRLTSLTEVGADPSVFAIGPDEFHQVQEQRALGQRRSMVALTTHDTKRTEDTRARISALAEIPDHWSAAVREWRAAVADLTAIHADGPLLNLAFQAAVGCWPITTERLTEYLLKSAKEAGVSTTWTQPDETAEQEIAALAERIVDGALAQPVGAFAAGIADAGWSNSLSGKLLQLTVPGVPDVYQGSELDLRDLVDPDNRRPVDFLARRALLSALDGSDPDAGDILDTPGARKFRVVRAALTLRRGRPELFTGYTALRAQGPAADHLVGFDSGGAVTLATRLPVGLRAAGGWTDTTVELSAARYRDVLTGVEHAGAGPVRLAEMLGDLPVALLVASS